MPLIYFFGLVEGQYLPVWPVFVAGDDPDALAFTVEVEAKDLPWEVARDGASLVGEGRRRYITDELCAVALDEAVLVARARGIEVLARDEALDALARIDPRKSRVVELRWFGGLSIEEAAEVLAVSVDTVKRDWRMAKAWLLAALTSAGS